MNKRPWMPLYIADYLNDTSHLRAMESGAYLHLIMAYWVNGKLPDNDRQLATIAKVTDKEWAKIKSTMAAFFGPDFSSHKRIDTELAKATDISNKRKAAVQQREIKRASNDASNDPSNVHTLHTSHSVSNETGAPAPPDPKAEYFRRGRDVLGRTAGGLLAKLLKTFGDEDDPISIAKARARIEEASTKTQPAEWLGRVMAKANPSSNQRVII
jgi:uncharacterized protein YdaU (DUF1376 family)